MRIEEYLNKFSNYIIHKLPGKFFGDEMIYTSKYKMIYRDNDNEKRASEAKRSTAKKYILVIVIGLSILILGIISSIASSKVLKEIERPAYGSVSTQVKGEIKVSDGENAIKKKTSININAKKLNDYEKRKALEDFSSILLSILLGNNKDEKNILNNLNLIMYHEDSNIKIKWKSDNVEVISEEGFVNSTFLKRQKKVLLTAELTLDDITIEKEYPFVVQINSSKAYMEGVLMNYAKEIVGDLSISNQGESVEIPSLHQNSIAVSFTEKKENGAVAIICITLVLLWLIYANRYKSVENHIKRNKSEIVRDFPDFVSKLVLLLNAGLVVTTAISKMSQDYKKHQSSINKKVLWEEIYVAVERAERTKVSLLEEIKMFSIAIGVKELIRLVGIIEENINMGSALAEKLETEGEMIWQTRKKHAEELGKIADTKLILPLIIMLGTLIVITITPTLLSM